MLKGVVVAVAQHLLRQAQWARARLAEHAGKQVRIELPLAAVLLRIAADGDVETGESGAAADLVVTLSPGAAAKWPIDRQAAWREARIDGDMELAAAISYVMANLRWDYEDDLSRVFGDVVAYRLARGVRQLSAWPGEAAQSLAQGAAEFLSEERHVLATRLCVEEFTEQVDELRDAVERLDKRIDKLAQRVAESSPH
ncbi:MAG: sterol-binding protein [Betaproteobacteria bacterium]|nr:MAG: sterol-binding protein [Betaproteobacteria bacterium]